MNTKTLCLGVLSLGKASGYDIVKQLEQIFSHFVDVSASGVYPALKSLHAEGLVQYEDVAQDTLPNKKIFELTEKGRQRFQRELEVLPPTHKVRSQFMLLIFFAEWLSSERLGCILQERLDELNCFIKDEEEWRKQVEQSDSQCFLLEYVLAKMKAEKEFLEQHADKVLDLTGSTLVSKLGEAS